MLLCLSLLVALNIMQAISCNKFRHFVRAVISEEQCCVWGHSVVKFSLFGVYWWKNWQSCCMLLQCACLLSVLSWYFQMFQGCTHKCPSWSPCL